MIVSTKTNAPPNEFEALLSKANTSLERLSETNPNYFGARKPEEFEEDVCDALCDSSRGTEFENSIELISGHKFPDIVANEIYGVEVKTSKSNRWKSLGNSVLETTRIENVERIYLLFGKLSTPAEFRYRLYQDCLYEVAVTHSPRYLIDMELAIGDSIFEKMNLSYKALRETDNPIKSIISYYRSISQAGQEPWWMSSTDDPDYSVPPTVSLWSTLNSDKQLALQIEAMARFPEIFGRSSTKYSRVALWLATRYGIVDSSLRDRFSAGGTVTLTLGKDEYTNLPRVYGHLRDNCAEILEAVKKIPTDDIKYYWDISFDPTEKQKIVEWRKRIIAYSKRTTDNAEEIITKILDI
jgi:hypothetical protein